MRLRPASLDGGAGVPYEPHTRLSELPEVRSLWRTTAGETVRAALSRPGADDYAVPLALWLEAQLARMPRDEPLIVGVHGPQGSGKSTLCEHLVTGLGAIGRRAVSLSIDDFYLTHVEQRALAEAYRGNRYLEHRGYPGTHDVDLGERVLAALATGHEGEVAVPTYDKSAHAGRGDRVRAAAWRRVQTPLDVVLFEGWMLAFRPVPDERVPEPALREPNTFLAEYRRWQRWLDALVYLEIESGDLEQIIAWRVDAERARRSASMPGLSDAEAHDYVSRFLPAYRLWTPALAADPGVPGPALRIALGPDRMPR